MTPDELRANHERQVRGLARRPDLGRTSTQTRAWSCTSELSCEVEHDGAQQQLVDLPRGEGGGGRAPHPGQLLRASIAACLALGYRAWAARLSVPLDAAEVEVTCELDVRGQLGVAEDVAIGWQRLIIASHLRGPAPEAELRRIAQHAERLSPMLANLAPAIERVHRVHVVDTRVEQDVPPDVTPFQRTHTATSGGSNESR